MPEGTLRRTGRTSEWLEDNPSNPTDPYSNTVGIITGIRSRLKTDELISWQDLDAIRDLLTLVRDHNHTYQDYQAIRDFGNIGPGTVGPTVRTVQSPIDTSTGSRWNGFNFLIAADPSWVGVDFKSRGIIYAADFNTMGTGFSRIARQHFHRMADDLYYTSQAG